MRGRTRPGLRQLADDALLARPAGETDLQRPQIRPRLRAGRLSPASSSASDDARGAWKRSSKSSSRLRAKARSSRFWSDTLPESSKRRSEARLTPDRRASVVCFLALALVHRREEAVLNATDRVFLGLLSKLEDERPPLPGSGGKNTLEDEIRQLRTGLTVAGSELSKLNEFIQRGSAALRGLFGEPS